MRPKRSMKTNLRQQNISSAISISPNPINIGCPITSNNALFEGKEDNLNNGGFRKDNAKREWGGMKLRQLEQENNKLVTSERTNQNNMGNEFSQQSHNLVNKAEQLEKKVNQGQEQRKLQSLLKIKSKFQDHCYKSEQDKKKINFQHAEFQEAYFVSRIKNLMSIAIQPSNRSTNNIDSDQNELKQQKPSRNQLQRPQTSYIYNLLTHLPATRLPIRAPTPYTITCEIHKFNTCNKLINTIQLQTQIDNIDPFKLSTRQSLSLYMLSMANITRIVQQIVTHYRVQHHLYQVSMHIVCFVEAVFVADGLNCCYDQYEGGVLSGFRVRSEHVEIRWLKAIKTRSGNLSKFIWISQFQVIIADKLAESVQITFRHMQLTENNLDNFKQFILTNSPHLNLQKAIDILYDSYLNIGILIF